MHASNAKLQLHVNTFDATWHHLLKTKTRCKYFKTIPKEKYNEIYIFKE